MRGLDDHADALWLQRGLQRVADLGGEALLHLETAGEHVDTARNLAQAEDAPVGDIGDVCLAEERQEMMLAEAVHLDVSHHHHLRVRLFEDRAVDESLEAETVAAQKVSEAPRYACRRADENRAGWILAALTEQFVHQRFEAVGGLARHGHTGSRVRALSCVARSSQGTAPAAR